ncbi:MAG TPA: tetratricopeptide repeat protein, partial [Thermoanaerobaculia bacterium]
LPKSARGGQTVAHPVQLIDVIPTIAKLTGASPRTQLAGVSLLDEPPQARRIYSETMLPLIHFGWSGLRSLVDARHHFIEAPRSEVYDVVEDPREQTNVASSERRVLADMRGAIAQHASELAQPTNVDPEEAAKLAALGYLGQVRSGAESGALPDPKDRIDELEQLKAASELERRGELQAAIAKYASIVATNPRFADAWLRMAGAQEKAGRPEDAIRSYRQALQVAPVLVQQIAGSLASLYLRLGQFAQAESHARLMLKAQPGAATVLLATIAIQQGKPADALRLLDAFRQSTTAPVLDLESTRGDALARMERVPEAEAAFRQEIAAFPNNREAYTRLAVLYAMLGRANDAENTLQRMFDANRSASTAQLAAETWNVMENRSAAARWKERAARVQ